MEETAEHPVPGHRASADEGFALLSVLLLILVFAAVSVLMLGAVIAQVKPTVFEAKSARTIIAAESGIDATLSQFRTATNTDALGDVYGDSTHLPCAAAGKVGIVAGTVGGGSATLRYDVTIRYFDMTPANHDETWRSNYARTCGSGGGLLNPPNFALIKSVGSDAAVAGYAASVGNRTLESVYTFQVSSSAINGGVIYAFNDAYCLEASSPRVAGATISYVAAADCRRDDPSRLWSYGKDYKIHLSVTDLAGATPLCITGRGSDAKLQVCANGPASDMMFSWEGGARWRGQNTNNTGTSSECLGSGGSSLTADDPLKITGCGGNDSEPGSFDPDPRVGPGAASYATHQVVNFLEFGRCFDVTDEDVTLPEMIIYPCKQDPAGAGANLFWNHKWFYTEPASNEVSKSGPIKVHNDGSKGVHADYCLTTPLDGGTYPTLSTPCDGSPRQTWTRTTQASTYADSWLFRDTFTNCLALGEKLSTAKPWTKMIVAPCNGGAEQKWNAPPNAQSASLDNFTELYIH